MVLNKYRKNVDSLLTKLAKPFLRVKPNTLTLLSLLFAFLGGLSFYLTKFSSGYLFLAFLFILLSAFMDALDGKIARLRKLSSRRGDFLDHLVDRYADTAIIVGIALSPYSTPLFGLFALTGVYLTSYIGTQAQAVGLKRIYGGFLGRADRMLILIILPLVQYFWWGYYFSVSSWVLLLFAILGHLTALQRIWNAWRAIPF
ncbi:MAG TPA: CDP-alcohol phosphatidyltransferase family protein [Candidatus Aciduliprofundum boonei]|uniref:CDP-alcohol phosphatidyltransferase family protein n=1 Tax=Candidatus Aciduliprofundum boonei TaxID=379547 RepID=A0A7J3T998_9ARCH|nr:CDP-alcohol phosphatidyltransferase family protein [Candidatus Aciduliprofundum boonei]